MIFTNHSKRLQELESPSETVYSTLLIDTFDISISLDTYDKVLVISETYQEETLSGFQWKLCVGEEGMFVSLYEKNGLSSDISFVIQGPLHKHTPYTLIYTAPYGSICLGLWDSDFPFVQDQIEKENIDNYYNKYFQIVSTLKGLLEVKSPYVIKVRSDEYYINFLPFLTKLKSIASYQILTSNIYFKNEWSYHISDHIMGSKTETLLSMFISAYKHARDRTFLYLTPEVHLALSFLSQFYPVHFEDTDNQKVNFYMSTFFSLYQIFEFENYKVKTTDRFITKEDGKLKDVNTLDSILNFKIVPRHT